MKSNTYQKEPRLYLTKTTKMYGMTYSFMAWKWGGSASYYYNLHKEGELKDFLCRPTKYIPKYKLDGSNRGHKSFVYAPEFRVQRKIILRVYNKVCQICGKPAKIAHHKDLDKNNNAFKNLMLVCTKCHQMIHRIDIRIGNMAKRIRR